MATEKTTDDGIRKLEKSHKQTEQMTKQIRDLAEKNHSLQLEMEALKILLQKTLEERDEAKNYFQTLFNQSGTVNIISNEDMTLFQVNDLGRSLSPEGKMLGATSWMKYVFPEDLEMIKKYHAQRYIDPASVPKQYEYRLKDNCGNNAVVRVTSSLIPGTNKTMSTFLDLTPIRQLAEDIRENELKYRTLFESSGDAILLIDETAIVDCNIKTLQLFNCRREDIVKAFSHPDEGWFFPERQTDGMPTLQRYEEAIKAAHDGLYEPSIYQLQRFDKTLFDAEIRLKVIHLGGKEFLMCMIRDVSELKRAEELYRTMANTTGAGVFIIQNGKMQFVNTMILGKYGYRSDEIIGRNYAKFIHPDDRKLGMKNAADILRDKSTNPIEFRVLAGNGAVRYILATYAYIVYEGKRAILGNCMDITELRDVKSKYNELQVLEKTILDTITHAVIGLQNRKIIFANPATERIFGWRTEELLGKDIGLLYRNDDDYRKFGNLIYTMLAHFADYTLEIPMRHKNGHELSCLNITSVIDKDVCGGRMVSVLEDITDRKKAESEKKKLEDQLIQSQKMEAVGTLAEGIAHDFNNLLMGIQGSTSILKMEFRDVPQLSNRLKTIEDLVKSGADLTRQLLGMGRQGHYKLKTIDINDLADKTASLFARAKKEITVCRTFEKPLPPVNVDQSQIEQMLLNLLVNAWQAMPSGGSIRLTTAGVFLPPDFTQAYDIEPGDYVKLSVEDTGIGMEASIQERIFEPFFTTKEIGKGTGLGLTMVYGIVSRHRGTIIVDSKPGQGARFDIYLPASTAEIEYPDENLPEIVKGNETILIIDDEEVIIDVSRDMLVMMGYTVLVAQKGEEAVALYAKQKETIDLVILDMIMPGMSGQEIFDRLQTINPAVKVILSSGYVTHQQIEDFMSKGCRSFLQKPFRTEELSKIIRDILDHP